MHRIIAIAIQVCGLLVASTAWGQINVEFRDCENLDEDVMQDILALETSTSSEVQGVIVRCAEMTEVEVRAGDQSLVRRIPRGDVPENGVERFLALNAAEMSELFARPREPEVKEEPPSASPEPIARESMAIESDSAPVKIHAAGLVRADLGAPGFAGGFALEGEIPWSPLWAIAFDVQMASNSTDIAGAPSDQLFLSGAVKSVLFIDDARFAALFRAGGVQASRDASSESGGAFWGGPALSAGYRLEIADPISLDGSTELGFSPWTWGSSFDGVEAFRTKSFWFAAQLGLTLSL